MTILYRFKESKNLSSEINPRTLLFKTIMLLILMLLNLSLILRAQEKDVKFHHISIEEGLSQSDVYCIMQDSRGFIWIGTEDGLNRYDGYSFKVYRNDPKNPHSLNRNNVRAIYEDSKGLIWIGTYGGGLNKFSREKDKFNHYKHIPGDSDSLSNDFIRSIYEDGAGVLWIATEDGLNRYDREKEVFVRYKNDADDPRSLSHNSVHSIYEDSSGILWIGTEDGLNMFEREKEHFIQYKSDLRNPRSLSNNFIKAIREDSSGTLWIGTYGGGLNRVVQSADRESSPAFLQYRYKAADPNSISSDYILSIYEDKFGMLWVGTEDGLNKFDRRTEYFTRYKNNPHDPQSLSNNNVMSICEDRSGVLWIGTDIGLNTFDQEKKQFILWQAKPSDPNSLSHNFVRPIYEDLSGVLWIGTYGGGLDKFDRKKKQFTHYKADPGDPNSLSNNYIRAIHEDSSGMFWIGTYGGGLNKFDKKTEKFTHYRASPDSPESLSNDFIRAILEDKTGVLWIATDHGLNKFDREKEKFRHYYSDPKNPHSLSNNTVYALYEDSQGVLWVGTVDGLNRYDQEKERFIQYHADSNGLHSLSSDCIYSMYEDQSGMFWIATPGGLNKFDREKETFTYYTERDGLPNDVIYAILEDKNGNFWLSTNKGLSRFNPRKEMFKNFDAKDGLQSNEFNARGYYKSRDGEMFFGGINGMNSFYPEDIRDNPYIPQVVITDFQIFNKPVSLGEDSDGREILKKPITETEEIELSYRDRVLSFEFAALHYASPDKNQYAYIMEGLEKEWNYVGNRRFATYTNLPSGDYIFRVKGSNNDGVWNEEGISLKIIITPPFWNTWWFKNSIIISILLLFVTIYKIRTHSIRERAKQLEKRVKEHTGELQAANKKLHQEIVEHKKTEEALRKSEERLHSLFDGIPIGLYQSTPGGKNIDANPALITMLRLPDRKAMLNENVVETYVNPKDRRKWKAKIEREGIVRNFETQWRRFDGKVIWIRESARAVQDNKGKVLYYEGAVEDITEHKKGEERLKQTLIELERSNKELEQFAYVASHDLQEPLRMVSSYTQLLDRRYRDKLDADAKEFISYAVDGATRMRRLINDLLEYSRVGTRDKPFDTTDCESILKRVLLNIKVAIEESGTVITHDPLPTVIADDLQLVQLFQNLIENAIKFRSEAPPRIHISAEEKGKEWIFSVRDNGIGIDPQYKERIFAIFQQLHIKEKYPGTGMGLAICKKIVERHSGKIWMESESSKGSTFYFTLPVKK